MGFQHFRSRSPASGGETTTRTRKTPLETATNGLSQQNRDTNALLAQAQSQYTILQQKRAELDTSDPKAVETLDREVANNLKLQAKLKAEKALAPLFGSGKLKRSP